MMATTEQEDEFARRYSAQGAKMAALPERGVWVDLARFDYHFIDHRVAQDTIGLMSEAHRARSVKTAFLTLRDSVCREHLGTNAKARSVHARGQNGPPCD